LHVTWFVDFDYDFTIVADATALADLRHSPIPVRLRGDTSDSVRLSWIGVI